MRNKVLTAITVILCIALTVCGCYIYNLNTDLNNTKTSLSNRINQLQNEIQGIYANVDQMLEEEASIISSESYVFGKINAENNTAELVCSVTPKEYDAEKTKAEIFINGKSYPMTFNNGNFSETISIPLFEESKIEKIVFTEDNTVRTQETVQYFSPRFEYLPDMSVIFSGSYDHNLKNQNYIEELHGTLDISIYGQTDNLQIASLDLVEIRNGVEHSRTPISSMESTHSGGISSFGSEEIIAVPDISGGNSQRDFSVTLNKTFEVPYGEYLIVYVEMKDSNSLVYRNNLFSRSVDDKGNLLSNDIIEGNSFSEIYTDDGKLLYSES